MARERGARLGEARLERRDARYGGVELRAGSSECDLDLGELLAAQRELQLELLHLAEQALLLAAHARELLLERRAALLHLLQPVLVARRDGRRGRRLRRVLGRQRQQQRDGRRRHQSAFPS